MSRPRPTRAQLTEGFLERDVRELLGSPAFLRFIFTVIGNSGYYQLSYRRGSTHDTAYLEGRRSLGLELMTRLQKVRPDVMSLIERQGDLLAEQFKFAPETPTPEDDDETPDPDPND